MSAASAAPWAPGRRARLGWAAALCFAQGLPFGIFTEALPVFLRTHGASLVAIGGLGSLQLAWSLKVLWSPLVERWSSWRRWMAGSLLLMAATLAVLAACARRLGDGDAAAAGPAGATLAIGGVALALFALASATQDVATDGAFVRLVHPGDEGLANGWRMGAYRAAMLVGGGGAVAASARLPWSSLLLATRRRARADDPRPVGCAGRDDGPQNIGRRLARGPARLGAGPRRPWGRRHLSSSTQFGDMAMASMVKPFWLAHGRSAAEIGLVSISLGLLASIAGGLAGGLYLTRRGIFRGLWVLGAWAALSNLGYAWVALGGLGRAALFAASALESATQGLGAAAQLALVTRLCDRDHATVQFALLTAIYGCSRALSGLLGGWGAQTWGFGPFFLASFFLCLPAVRQRLRAGGDAA